MGEVVKLNQEIETSPEVFSSELEQQILGALLLDNGRVAIVAQSGGDDLFHDAVHKRIYSRIASLERDDILASPVTMTEWARADEGIQELGGPGYLVRLAAASVSGSQLSHYVQHAAELTARRRIISAMDEARKDILEGQSSAAHVAGRLEAGIASIEGGSTPRPVSMMTATTTAVREAWAAHNGEATKAVPSGIHTLDRMIGGFYPGEMTLLGGRPSMGKTAVAVNVALNAARAGHGVAFCSLEMQPDAIALRAMSEHMATQGKAVSYRDLRGGQWSDIHQEAFEKAADEVSQLPIYMLPRQYADIGALMAGAKRAKALLGGNLRLLIVDYIQLMRAARTTNRYELITEISTALKLLAGRLDVPVLALSQLSRQVESREDKRPMLSDLRESGQLEQDADAVLFCYRDEYYLEREKPQDPDLLEGWQNSCERARNRLEIIVAKQRQGPIGTANVYCNVALNRIWEADR